MLTVLFRRKSRPLQVQPSSHELIQRLKHHSNNETIIGIMKILNMVKGEKLAVPMCLDRIWRILCNSIIRRSVNSPRVWTKYVRRCRGKLTEVFLAWRILLLDWRKIVLKRCNFRGMLLGGIKVSIDQILLSGCTRDQKTRFSFFSLFFLFPLLCNSRRVSRKKLYSMLC